MKFILASTSKYRQALLKRSGFDFEAVKPLTVEEQLKKSAPPGVEEYTRFLALKKAESLLEKYPQSWVVGCDQAAASGKRILEKPLSRERAIAQLKMLGGRWHRLITSMAIVKSGEIPTVMTDITRIRLRPLSMEDLAAYVDHDKPLDCAGSYKIEKAGICLIEDMRCKDPTSIEGISIVALTSFFVRQGHELSQFLKFS